MQTFFERLLGTNWRNASPVRDAFLDRIGVTPTVFDLYFNWPLLDYVHDCCFYHGGRSELIPRVDHAIRLGLGLETVVHALLRYDTQHGAKICPENQEDDVLHASECDQSIHLTPPGGELDTECKRLIAKRDETIANLKKEIAALTYEIGIAKAHVSRQRDIIRERLPSPTTSEASIVPESHWLSSFPTPPDVQQPLPDIPSYAELYDYDSDELSAISVSSASETPDQEGLF